MADHNIYVRARMGNDSAGSRAKGKLSAKGSAQNAKETSSTYLTVKGTTKGIGNAVNFAGGNAPGLGQVLGTLGKVGLAIGAVVGTAVKVSNIGINIYEAQTGESMNAHNARSMVQTISTLGLNVLSGKVNNLLTTQHNIRRQNISMDYYRELYNLNMYGEKNKIR